MCLQLPWTLCFSNDRAISYMEPAGGLNDVELTLVQLNSTQTREKKNKGGGEGEGGGWRVVCRRMCGPPEKHPFHTDFPRKMAILLNWLSFSSFDLWWGARAVLRVGMKFVLRSWSWILDHICRIGELTHRADFDGTVHGGGDLSQASNDVLWVPILPKENYGHWVNLISSAPEFNRVGIGSTMTTH